MSSEYYETPVLSRQEYFGGMVLMVFVDLVSLFFLVLVIVKKKSLRNIIVNIRWFLNWVRNT